jgi:hypothetical protein
VPNRPRIVALYTDAARAAPPPTNEADTAIIVAQAAIDPANDQKCNHPRIRGFGSTGSGALPVVSPVVTPATLRHP